MKTDIKHCQHCKKTDGNLSIHSRHNGRINYMCRECNTERIKKYRQTSTGRIKTNIAVYKSTAKHWEKQKARLKLNYHVRVGNIFKPIFCSVCDQTKKIEGHHPDYSKPLEVIWCCRSCHADLDKIVDKSF